MKKATDKEVLDAVEKHGQNVDAIASELSLAKSNVFYRLRSLKTKGRLNVDGEVIHDVVPQTAFATASVNREDNADEVKAIEHCEVDIESLRIAVDPDYIHRPVDDRVETLVGRGRVVKLLGDAGCGKSTLPEQLSARLNVPFVKIACDDTSVLKELLGKPHIKNGTTYFKTGILPEIVVQPCVVFFDEDNAIPSGKSFFFHEFLDNRRILIKDADGGLVINFHPECRIILASNFNNGKYSGTNKTNVALADRPNIIHVPSFTPDEVASIFDTGDAETTKNLKQFYVDVNKSINSQGLRLVFSLRGVKRIAEGVQLGDDIETALEDGLFNHALVTASENEKEGLVIIARATFGADKFTKYESNYRGGE